MSLSDASQPNEVSSPEGSTDADDESQVADASADAKAILIMFVALVLFAVHFASGWTFDF